MARLKDRALRLILLFTASLLSILNSVSLPTFATLDVSRAAFNGTLGGVDELRMGPWSFCLYLTDPSADPCEVFTPCDTFLASDLRTCSRRHYGYTVRIMSPQNKLELVNIGNSWTRGLATHAAAAVSTILAFALLLTNQRNQFLTLLAYLTTLIAFMTDIVFYFHTRDILGTLQVINVQSVSDTGPGFWLSLAIFCLVVAESSVSEGDLKLKRLKNAMFSENKALSDTSDAQPEKIILKDRNLIVPEKVLLYECPLCYESKLELLAMPCRGAHVFCRRCIEAHLKRSIRCPRCISDLPVYKEDLRPVVIISASSDSP